MSKKTIRRDIFAVKEQDGSLGPQWCYVFMTRNAAEAFQRAKDIRADHSLGIRRDAKVVHPAQWIVDAFLLAGNTIH